MSDNPSQFHFIDTNILVYAHDVSAGEKHTRAANLIKTIWESRNGCVSVQVLQEFYVTITRKVAKPVPPSTAVQVITDLSSWKVHSPTVDDILRAIQIHDQLQISFWNAMIIVSAEQCQCSMIWSEDLQHGQLFGTIHIQNPFNILSS